MIILCINTVFALDVNKVKLDSYVNDYTGTLSAQEIQEINIISESLRQNGVAEVAVVIVDNMNGLSKEEYALKIAHEKLGDTKLDNGLLILVAKQEREFRIEVGYGLEGDLPDSKVGRIARELLIPQLSAGLYGKGIIAFTLQIHKELLPNTSVAVQMPVRTTTNRRALNELIFYMLFFGVIVINRLISGFAYYKEDKEKRKKNGEKVDDNFFTAALFASMFMHSGGRGGNFGRGMGGFSGGGFGGGGFGGGGFGGSF